MYTVEGNTKSKQMTQDPGLFEIMFQSGGGNLPKS